MSTLPITAIILTYNEEKNIEACLQSLSGWVQDIFVVDSYSTDGTLAIAGRYTPHVVQHEFINYAEQRNWALHHLPIQTEWIINIDADNRISPELVSSLKTIFEKNSSSVNGYLASRRTVFMNRWIKYGGHYPTYHAFMFRKGYGHCENKAYDQHFVVSGKTAILKGDIIDILTDSLTSFTQRHNKWSSLEAEEQLATTTLMNERLIRQKLSGNPIEKRRYFKNIYNSFPLFVRPLLYFIYRYFIRLGFLDGKEGLIFHFLQCFWFRFLVDAKVYEIKMQNQRTDH